VAFAIQVTKTDVDYSNLDKRDIAEFLECVEFLWEEFRNAPITEGPLKGEFDCSLAVKQMTQLGALIQELRITEKNKQDGGAL